MIDLFFTHPQHLVVIILSLSTSCFCGGGLHLLNVSGELRSNMFAFIRVLIRGSGSLGSTKIDHRANSPAFRMTGNAVVAGIDIDMTGFRESILVSGDAQCQPIFLKCIIRCSGDDAVNLTGHCKPLFHACEIEVSNLL